MYHDGEYESLEFWWDGEDNEYLLRAVWRHYRQTEAEPEEWALADLEVEECPRDGNDLDVSMYSNVWWAIANRIPENPKGAEY